MKQDAFVRLLSRLYEVTRKAAVMRFAPRKSAHLLVIIFATSATIIGGSDCTEVATKWESLSSSQEDGLASLDEPQTLGALPIIPFSSDNRERDPKLLLRYGFLQHVPAVSSVHGRTARFQIVASLPLSTSSKLFLKRVKRISIDSSPPAPV